MVTMTLTRMVNQKRGLSIGVFTSFPGSKGVLDRLNEFRHAFDGVFCQSDFCDDDHDHKQDEQCKDIPQAKAEQLVRQMDHLLSRGMTLGQDAKLCITPPRPPVPKVMSFRFRQEFRNPGDVSDLFPVLVQLKVEAKNMSGLRRAHCW